MDPAGRDHLANWNPTLRDPVLAAERQGRWRWPFALLGTGLAITLLIVFIVGGGSIAEWRGLSFDMEPKPGQAGGFVALVVYGFALMLAVIALAPLHGRRWSFPFTYTAAFRWGDFLKAALALLAANLLALALTYAFERQSLSWNTLPTGYWKWFALTVAVLLVQSLGEEVLFRGYLFRIWGAVVPHRLLVLLPISATFIALHTLNDDFKQDPPGGYIQFIVGEAIAYFMVMRTGSLAAGWGLHWLNNAWAFAILPTVPGQSFDVAIAIYRSPVLEQGRSNVGDPLSIACFVLGVGLLLVLLLWRGSPLYLAPGAWQPLPVERPVPAPHDEQPATPIV